MPANADGAPVPRSRNREGVPTTGGGGALKKGAVADRGQTPAVGGAHQTSQSQNASVNENDTFNKHYNKELRVSKDEIPIVLAELNDSAYRFIKRE